MKRNEQITLSKPLEAVCSQYIDERRGLGQITLGEIAHLYMRLQGRGISNAPLGFTQFLKRSGPPSPALAELTPENIASYWEYVAQHFGLIEAAEAMSALKQLWVWCSRNHYISRQPMPLDLKSNGVTNRYRVTIKIKRPS